MSKTRAQITRDSDAKRRERGYVRIQPWIPERDREKVMRYIEKIRKAYEKEIAQ